MLPIYCQYLPFSLPNTLPYVPQQIYYFTPCAQLVVQPAQQEPTPSSDPQESEEECLKRCRHTWTKQQDAELLRLIKSLDLSPDKPLPFGLIAQKFPGRSAKQIRQRYQNKLDSTIAKTKFTEAQDRVILEFYKTNGPKWKQLSKRLKGRTPIGLRNRFNAKIKQQLVEEVSVEDGPLKLEDSR